MKKCILGLLFVILSLLPAGVVQATAGPGQAYVLVIDKLAISDIDRTTTPVLEKLVKDGAVGLASNRTLGRSTTDDGSLTIGAGNLARSPVRGIMGYNRDEMVPERGKPAGQLYRSLTGIDPVGYQCLLVNLPEVMDALLEQNVTTRPGALGEVLHRHNLKVCVLGNGDTIMEKSRSAVAIAMDASGRIPLGDVGPATCQSSTRGFLDLETDYAYLRSQVARYRTRADVLFIQLSDLYRLEKAEMALPEVQLAERHRILHNIDQLVGSIREQVDPSRDLLMVISPSPAAEQIKNKNTFTPVILYGPGYQASLLTSGATRRDYIVANTDIAPTILNFFGLKDEDGTMIGQPMLAKPAGTHDKLAQVNSISQASSTTNRLRPPLVKGYVVLQIAVIILALLAILLPRRPFKGVAPLVLALAVVPLVLLPLGKLRMPYDWNYVLVAILGTMLLTLVLVRFFRRNYFRAFVALCLLTLVTLNLDVLTGTTMIQNSVLGYDAMAGARYYGLGNEYMGVLLGCTLIVAAALYQRFSQPWMLGLLAILFISQCYLIAAPGLGASSDGVITAPIAFLLSLALLADVRINHRVLLLVGLLVVLGISGVALYDMTRPLEHQSHIGRAANQVLVGGWQEGFTIMARKVGMNVKLIRYTVWSRVFLVILASLAILVYRPAGAMARIKDEYPCLMKGFAGIIIAAVVGLVINDSGIVAAATTSIYIVIPALILVLEQVARHHPERPLFKP